MNTNSYSKGINMDHIKNGDVILFRFPHSNNTYLGKILGTEVLEKTKWYDVEYISPNNGPTRTSIPPENVTCKVSTEWFKDLAYGGLNAFKDYHKESC